MALTRREFVERAGVALTASGLYGLLDSFGTPPARAAAPAGKKLWPEQHVLSGLKIVTQEGVEVVVQPLYHQIVTARLRVPRTRSGLEKARVRLERALAGLERRYAPAPAGLGVTVGWGLPYFRRYVPRAAAAHLPVDLRASKAAGKRVRALLDTTRFASDDPTVVLEENDVVVQLRSDSLERIAAGAQAIFAGLDDLFQVTTIRKGFIGGGFGPGESIPQRLARAAGLPGADLIPDGSQLFLGFTSTQKTALGPDGIASFETLPGLTNQWPRGYFRGGTTMHLSHLHEDLEAWWKTFDFDEQVRAVARPGLTVRDKNYTLPMDVPQIETAAELAEDVKQYGATGHSGAIQPASRLTTTVVGHDGKRYAKGTPVIQRADFNTLDNPFFWSPLGVTGEPAAGVHFVAFAATTDTFNRTRRAMDGRLPGARLDLDPRSRAQGFNSVIRATHRQNFLVPPRAHRSFPLAELGGAKKRH